MTNFIAFVILMLPLASSAEDLCFNTAAAVCPNNVPPARDNVREIEKRVEGAADKRFTQARLQAMKEAKDLSAAKFADDYLEYIKLVYAEVLVTLKQAGFSEADADEHIAHIRDRIANQVLNGALPDDRETGRYSNQKLAKYVGSIKLLTPKNIDEGRKKAEWRNDLKSFEALCDFNGLKPNAYYDGDRRAFMVCPGMLVNAASARSLHALDVVIAHELGHSVDASARPAITEEKPPLLERYKPFMECLERNFQGEIFTIRSQIKRLEFMGDERTPDLTKLLERTKLVEEWYTALLGHSPLASESNAKELIADTFSNMTAAEILSELPERERPEAFAAAFGALCSARDANAPRDGQHPHAEFRLNRAMWYSGMRRALGCRNVETEKAWCSLKGDNQ